MSGNSNQKAINLLNQIQYKTGISDCEKNALIQVFDPYADFEHKVVGWPSLQETKSNVTKNDYTMTIAAPDTEGGNWDCAIFMPKQTNVTSKLSLLVLQAVVCLMVLRQPLGNLGVVWL